MKTLRWYLLASLLFHFIFLWAIPASLRFAKPSEPIWIDLKEGKYEVVDILPPPVEERPEQAQFLGMYDSRTEEEAVAETVWKQSEGKGGAQKETQTTGPGTGPIGGSEGAMPLEDYFPDFRHGKHTYLNVLRFPDISYFVRLKRAFKMTFNPLSPLREAYFEHRIARGKIETVLGLAIDREGNLAELFVLRESGLSEYDQEALRTIRASAPFSAPPGKLLEDGLLRMSWTFTVYL